MQFAVGSPAERDKRKLMKSVGHRTTVLGFPASSPLNTARP